jgi:hypothetical protein
MGRKVKAVSAAARQEFDLGIGLALVGLEYQGKMSVRGQSAGRSRSWGGSIGIGRLRAGVGVSLAGKQVTWARTGNESDDSQGKQENHGQQNPTPRTRCSQPTAIYDHALLRISGFSFRRLFPGFRGGRRNGAQNGTRARGSRGACVLSSEKWTKKFSNYLNI